MPASEYIYVDVGSPLWVSQNPLLPNYSIDPASPESIYVGADPVGSQSYTIPAGAIYVSPSGSDSNNGLTVGAPKLTIPAAHTTAPTNGFVVMRAGDYPVSEWEPTGKGVTFMNYPGEAVWWDGSYVVTGWTSNGNGTWSAPYTVTLDRQLGKGSGISTWGGQSGTNGRHLITDQVWVDGVRYYAANDSTTPGALQFSVNQTADTLTIATDPAGKVVRAAGLKWSAVLSNSTLKGFGIRRYSPQWIEYRSAALMTGQGVTMEQMTIEDSGLDLLSLGGPGTTVSRSTFQRGGHSGVMGDDSKSLIFETSIIRNVNQNLFDDQPATASFKMTRVFEGVTIRFNLIDGCPGAPGIWFDTTVSRSKIYGNTVLNVSDGIVIEGSDGGYYDGVQYYTHIVGNRISNVSRCGIMASISGYIRKWNNDVYAAVAFWSWQDYRQNTGSKPSTEGTVQQSPWHCEHIDVVNNRIRGASPFYTRLRLQTNSDASYKTTGGAMLERFSYNWVDVVPSGQQLAYISDQDGTFHSVGAVRTLAHMETLASQYGGPLSSKMQGNVQSDTAPTGSGMGIPADMAAAVGLTLGQTYPMASPCPWPDLTPAA